MRNASSVKDRLKNYAKKSGRTVQDALTVYVLERVLYRISVSRYADDFTLKGGILLYGLYTDDFTRATTDIDLLGEHISNDLETLKTVFGEILNTETDDPIRFDRNTLEAANITEFKKYHGARISVTAYLDRTRIHVGIDIGFGDVVYPKRQKMNYPTLLDDDPVALYGKRQLPPSGVCHPDGGVRISFGMQRPAGPHGRSPAFFVARKKRSERRLTGPSFTPLCSSSRSPSSLRRFPSPPPS